MHFARLYLITLSLLTVLLLSACGPTTVGQLTKAGNVEQLTAGKILLVAKNNTLSIQGHKVNTYLYFDGSGYAYGRDIYKNKDTGIWDVSEQGELCFKMKDWWFGKLRCFSVYHDGRKYYLANNSGVLEFTADQYPGDTKNLYFEIKGSKKNFLIAERREKESQPSSTAPGQDTETKPSEDPASPGGPTPEELKSTVKWMAKDCPGCNLADTNLSEADLIGADLEGADLSGADLSRANLRRANLKDADLEDADLSYANMPGADLRESDLTNANFKGANLIRANLTGAKTQGANFEGALLEGVEGLNK